jgi:hypothetical protein
VRHCCTGLEVQRDQPAGLHWQLDTGAADAWVEFPVSSPGLSSPRRLRRDPRARAPPTPSGPSVRSLLSQPISPFPALAGPARARPMPTNRALASTLHRSPFRPGRTRTRPARFHAIGAYVPSLGGLTNHHSIGVVGPAAWPEMGRLPAVRASAPPIAANSDLQSCHPAASAVRLRRASLNEPHRCHTELNREFDFARPGTDEAGSR